MYRGRNRYGGGNKSRYGGALQRVKEPEEPDHSASIGYANTEIANSKVYLVKLPDDLYNKFLEAPTEGERPILGRLRLPQNDGQAGKAEAASIIMDTPGGGHASYELNFQRAANIHVFSEEREAKQPHVRVEGRVAYQCTAQPTMDKGFRAKNRTRIRAAATRVRQTKMMDDNKRREIDNKAFRPQSGMETAEQREERKRAKDAARRYMDAPNNEWHDAVKKLICLAYESRMMYTVDELAREVSEPPTRIRNIVNELCLYNKSGPFSSHYTLKTEFLTENQRQERDQRVHQFKLEQIEKLRTKKLEDAAEERAKKRARTS